MRLVAIVCLCLTGGVFAQSEPPLVTTEDSSPTVEAPPPMPPPAPAPAPYVREPVPSAEVEVEDPAARSTWRFHAAIGGGWVATTSSATPLIASDIGPVISVGKPLYEADRHRFYQWVTDTTILVGYAPGKSKAMLVMTPTFGTNFYLGPVFGIEWRAGVGFGATPSSATNIGFGISFEGALTLRLFSDDRRRIKLQLHDAGVLGLLGGSMVSFTTIAGALAFETPL